MSRQLAEVRSDLLTDQSTQEYRDVGDDEDGEPPSEDPQPLSGDLETTSLGAFYRALDRLGIEDRPDPAAMPLLDYTEQQQLEPTFPRITTGFSGN
jgi:hypothetical protein